MKLASTGWRREWPAYMWLLMVVVMLAGCGASPNGKTAGEGSVAEPEESALASVSPVPSAHADKKKVETIFGDIDIPVHPQRIVAEDYLGSLIALEVIPAGTPGLHLDNPYFAEALKGVEDIGDYGNPSLEKVIALGPDLIITSSNDKDRFEKLNKIAPTVSIPYGDLKNAHEELAYFGELLGVSDKAEAWLAQYDERIAAAKSKVDAAIGETASFSILERSEKAIWVYGDNFGRGGQPVYQALGRKPKAEVADELMEKQWMELSLEVLPQYAGDYLVVTVGSSSDWLLENFQSDPVWGSLDAVKNNRIYVWEEKRSWYYDPIAVLSQTEELAAWLAGE